MFKKLSYVVKSLFVNYASLEWNTTCRHICGYRDLAVSKLVKY
jgi:hypothetical protein